MENISIDWHLYSIFFVLVQESIANGATVKVVIIIQWQWW